MRNKAITSGFSRVAISIVSRETGFISEQRVLLLSDDEKVLVEYDVLPARKLNEFEVSSFINKKGAKRHE